MFTANLIEQFLPGRCSEQRFEPRLQQRIAKLLKPVEPTVDLIDRIQHGFPFTSPVGFQRMRLRPTQLFINQFPAFGDTAPDRVVKIVNFGRPAFALTLPPASDFLNDQSIAKRRPVIDLCQLMS